MNSLKSRRLITLWLILYVLSLSARAHEQDTAPDQNFSLIQLPTQFKARKLAGRAVLNQGDSYDLLNAKGPGCVRHITVIYKPFGDHARIRIFADDTEQPQVDMDLNAFFGVLMNNDPRTTGYRSDGAGMKVIPEAGFNCYLPIPFQSSCRIELTTESRETVQLYSQVDWQQYDVQTKITPFRLHALHNKETPAAKSYGGIFQIADVSGRGFVAGLFKAIRHQDKSDILYHTGGSVWLVDGESDPHAIRGYNEEDDFGFGWAYHQWLSRWTGCAYVVNPGQQATEFSAYRWYGPDPIPFKTSLIAYSGSRADDTETVLYFYKELESEAPNVESPQEWQVTGPYRSFTFEEFLESEAPESEIVWPDSWQNDGRTLLSFELSSHRTWVDMTWEFRGRRPLWNDYAKAFSEQSMSLFSDKPVAVSAYARTTIESESKRSVNLRLAFDDWLTLWVNGEKIGTRRHDLGYEIADFPVQLRSGENTIQIKLSNFDNQEHRLWAFSCAVVDDNQNSSK
jgi:hypothetical protein